LSKPPRVAELQGRDPPETTFEDSDRSLSPDPAPHAMQSNSKPEHACPRCYQELRVVEASDDTARAVLLACPEAYCDYVLVLTERESFSARKWSWPDLFRFTRAAG
jgi:hypothetical protein